MTDPAHDPKRDQTGTGHTDANLQGTGRGGLSEPDASGRKGPARAAATIGPESRPGSISTGAGAETEQPFIDQPHAERPYTDRSQTEWAQQDERYAESYGEAYATPRRTAVRSDYPSESGSIPQLLRRLVDDVSTLVRKELALATSEISHSVDDAKQGLISMVTGGAVLYLGIVYLLAAATLGLALFMPGWAAALIVGGLITLVGAVMVVGGKKKMEPSMKRTSDSLRKDRDMIERQTS
jgi:hypothetical protein